MLDLFCILGDILKVGSISIDLSSVVDSDICSMANEIL